MQQVTPKALADLYALFSPENKTDFLRLLGRQMTADQHFLVYNELPTLERSKLTGAVFDQFAKDVVPEMLLEAVKAAQRIAPEKVAELQEVVAERMTAFRQDVRELVEAEVKATRDRKSDPENIRRNVLICDRRRDKPDFWTLGRLAKTYHVTTRAITKVLKEEAKWRKLAAELGTN